EGYAYPSICMIVWIGWVRQASICVVIGADGYDYLEATSLARKVPVVNYEIIEQNNKPYYKIIRADEESKKCTRSSKSQGLEAIGIMWCIDHYIYNHQLILLVERRYPLIKFTLDHMLNAVRLEVKEESEVSLELLRMSLATFPLSFWDYALESATRILNMVPTKKVDKTPYELWHGKVPNLSYLKETICYYFYYPPENKIVVERYADFLEKDFILQKESRRIVKLEDEYILPSENTSECPIEEERLAPIVFQEEDVIPARGSNVIFLILYVNDIILMGNHIPSLQEVKTYLGKCFSMKDLEEATFILGIKIYRDRSTRLIGLSQNSYLNKILKRYRMDNSKRGSIPMQVDLHLSKSQCATTSAEMKHMQNVRYASAVRPIMYAVRCVVVWKSSKQSTTAQHATKAKCIAASEAAKEAVWIRKFIDELGVVPLNDYPIKMNCDNSAAINMAKELGIQKGTRHFKRKYHYVRECIEIGEIDIVKVHTDDNLANLFTKGLAGLKLT
nr:retrotransposon protein, putative, Ty1-copia subclass [Tanacetum cinerariifolium]